MKVVWRPAARADAARIVRYIAERNPLAAVRLAQELVVAADSLSMLPRRGRIGRDRTTRELTAVWPYVVVYRILPESNSVRILRVWHGAQSRG